MPRKSPKHSLQDLNVNHLKPEKFKNYLTLGELVREVGKDESWIRRLERAGKLPAAKRHRIGELSIRLNSPAAVEEIKLIFSKMHPGRPKAT